LKQAFNALQIKTALTVLLQLFSKSNTWHSCIDVCIWNFSLSVFPLPPWEHSRRVDICLSWLLNSLGSPQGGCRHDFQNNYTRTYDDKIGLKKKKQKQV